MAPPSPPGRVRAMPAVLFAGLFSALIVAGATCQGVAPDVRFDSSPLPPGGAGPIRFVICGDTRVSIEPWRSSTREERERVAGKVLELRPAFVLNSGDLVGAGGNYRMWQVFDRLTEKMRQAGIRYLPALGNHEYYGKNEHAMKMYFERFPDLKGKKWYAYDAGPARLLILDSNFDEFEGDEASRQSAWLEEALEQAQADAAVRFVILVCHHPAFTNSGHEPSPEVLDHFIKPALQFPKYRAMINGHVHTYERFEAEGRTYVVSGGGGAPLYSVEVDPAKWRRTPAYLGPADRGHHVVECTVGADSIRCEVLTLAEDGTWSVTDSFKIR